LVLLITFSWLFLVHADETPHLRSPEILITDWEGRPLDLEPNGTLIATDADLNPLFHAVAEVLPGRYRLEMGGRERFCVITFIEVPGFGCLKVVADAGGGGYPAVDFRKTPMNLNRELARSRALATLAAVGPEDSRGLPPNVQEREKRVRNGLARLDAAESEMPLAEVGELLSEGLWFGEELVIAQARATIASSPKRSGFLFGANASAVTHDVPRYRELFADLFNSGVVPFFLRHYEREQGQVDPSRTLATLEFLEENGLETEGTPLVWFHRAGCADWLDGRSYEEVREICRKRVAREVEAYRGRVDTWIVINEAHDWANRYGYSQDQLIELTKITLAASKAANPDARRVVNCTLVFGEYAARGQGLDRHPSREVMTPRSYVERLLDEGIQFEVIGLQFYYTGFDLFEHQRAFDRFARFGLPLRVTEVAVPSSMEIDPNWFYKNPNAIREKGIWRRPWDPELQAEFSDATPHFFPRGGLQDEKTEPKPAYHTLRRLFTEWGSIEQPQTTR
jgi:hypothetical protein